MAHKPFILAAGQLATGEPLFLRGDVRVGEGSETVSSTRPKPVLVICHGFKGFKDWGFFPYAANRFAEEGFYTITFNFSCNGVAETDFDELNKFALNTYSREQNDLAILLEAARSKQLPLSSHADTGRVLLLGHSRGGGSSILYAADHPDEVKAMVTWNGIAKADLFDDAFKEQIASHGVAYVANARTKQEMPIRSTFYEDLEQHGERYHIVKRLSELTLPVLLVQGDQDSPRLVEGFEAMRLGATQHKAAIIAGGNHTLGAVHPFVTTTPFLEEAIRLTVQFFKKAIDPSI
ncbi:alpha/beta hydrolase [Paenibacillus rigui]|uniref:Alpha/beta hydrolase n=1 Tax=Paenibacillus rigui TaxID=554312 RepID=A0A229UVC8_9BACL|nr:alpha/beta hydrolase [Paenibacillus rigui]